MANVDKWYNKPVRVLQFNIEDRYGVYVSQITGKELVELADRIHANTLVIFARDPWGRIYYRGGKAGPEHEKMQGDLVRDAIAEGRRRGIKVVVMIGHTANKHLYTIHSDWAQVNKDEEIILLEHVPYDVAHYEPEWPQLCINSPFIKHIRKEIREAVDLDVDGIFLDSFRYQPDIERACYCRWCRGKFKEEHGYEMPREPKWSDSRWRELWEWRYRVVVERIRELYRFSKNIAPNKLFMYNSHPGGWAGRTNRIVEMARDYMDVVFAECSEVDHQPPGFVTEMVKLTRAMTGGKPVWASRNYFHLYRTPVSTTPLAIRQGLREAIVGGGSPWLLVFSISYKQDPWVLDAAKQVFMEHERIEEYLAGAEPVTYAGIVVSNKTRDHYGREHPDRYVDEIRGFYYALVHSHLPVEFIAERDLINLNMLKKYKVIVLANTACMSSEAMNTIREYVREGGRVVATYLASARDGECIRRYDLGLKDVFGGEQIGVHRHTWSYMVLDKKDHWLFKDIIKDYVLVGDMSYEFLKMRVSPTLGWQIIIRPSTGKTLAYIGLAGGFWGYEYTLGRSPPPCIGKLDNPSILINRYGDGESIYFAWQVGRHYWRTGLPEYLLLIRNAVQGLAGKPMVEVDAPETVDVGVFKQGDRIIVHLLNHTYNQRILATGIGKVRQPLPPYSSSEAVHPIREVIPIDNIVVRLNRSGEYRAYMPLRNRYLDTRMGNGWIEVSIPRLGEYEVVVFEKTK